jgi:hypothetical protein
MTMRDAQDLRHGQPTPPKHRRRSQSQQTWNAAFDSREENKPKPGPSEVIVIQFPAPEKHRGDARRTSLPTRALRSGYPTFFQVISKFVETRSSSPRARRRQSITGRELYAAMTALNLSLREASRSRGDLSRPSRFRLPGGTSESTWPHRRAAGRFFKPQRGEILGAGRDTNEKTGHAFAGAPLVS